jgi:hypothetical protein
MTGPVWSVIGFDPKTVLPRFINALADAVRGGRRGGRLQRGPDRHRPGDWRALAIERIARYVEV